MPGDEAVGEQSLAPVLPDAPDVGFRSVLARAGHYFLGTVFSSLVAFATLPFTTRILGPANYGVFALGATVVGLGATLATLGATFVLNNRYPAAGAEERRRLISTLSLTAFAAATTWSIFALAAFATLRNVWTPLGQVSLRGLALMLVTSIPACLWIIAIDVMILVGRSGVFLAATVLQTIASSAGTLFTLYVIKLGGTALFVGASCANLVAFFAALFVLRGQLSLRLGLRQRERLDQWRFLYAQAFDSAQPLFERALLTRFAGFTQLGRYSHSQSYRGVIFQSMNAVSRGAWPTTITEAHEPAGRFQRTGATWSAVQLGITAGGIPLVLFGTALTGFLTNGKLTGAASFFGPWIVLVLLQSSGRAAGGILYVLGQAKVVANLNLKANVSVFVAGAILIPLAGPVGAAGALIAQAIVYRILLVARARRYREVPFQDSWVVIGGALITALTLVRRYVAHTVDSRLAVLFIAEAVCLAAGAPVVRSAWRFVVPQLQLARERAR